MLEVAWSAVRRRPGRLAALVVAIGLPVTLVLVTSGVYLGLIEAMVAFPRALGGDLVVTQAGGSPILMRSTSRVPPETVAAVARVSGVVRVDPLVGRLVWVEERGRRGLVFVIALLPDAAFGGPAAVLAGRARPELDEVIVDRVLAHDLDLGLRTSLRIAGARFRVGGIADGGNSVLGTFAWIHRNALALVGPTEPSHLFVTLAAGADAAAVARRIARVPGVQAYAREAFLDENRSLARQFYRPIIGIIAGISALVGAVVLGMALAMAVVEDREDHALLRAVGIARRRVYAVVLWQAAIVAGLGVAAGVAGGVAAAAAIERFEPRFVTTIPWWLCGLVVLGAAAVALLAAWMPARSVARTDPALVFRA